MNAAAVEAILAAVKIPLQLGGGIRDIDGIEAWLGKGVARVIIGTAAVRDPDLVRPSGAALSWPHRGRHRRAGRAGRGRRLGQNLGAHRTRTRPALRGCGRRRHRLYRHRPRWRSQGAEHRGDAGAGRRADNPGDRLGRPRLARRRGAVADAGLRETRRRDRRASALRRAARPGGGAGADPAGRGAGMNMRFAAGSRADA